MIRWAFFAGAAAAVAIAVLFACGKQPEGGTQKPTFSWVNEDVVEATRIIEHEGPRPIVPTLINGTPVSPNTWKHVVRIRTGNSGCTASIVGPRVLATASHCASTGATSVFTIDGVQYSAKITRHPLYPRKDMDVSLGLIDREVKLPEYGVLPGTVDVVKVGMPIRLMGYGCTNAGGTGGNDGVLREGMSQVSGFSNFDIVTGKTTSGAALCYGDSGGPAWLAVELNGTQVLLNISQNSKGDIAKISYLARWDVKEAQDFVREWAQTNSAEVCGINKECGVGPGPVDPLKFAVDGKTVTLSGTIKVGNLAREFVERIMANAVMFLDQDYQGKQ